MTETIMGLKSTNLSVVQLSIHIYLTLSNVTSQIWYGMGDVCRKKKQKQFTINPWTHKLI